MASSNLLGKGRPRNSSKGEEHMKEEWLFPNAIVSVDVETTAALVAEIKRLIHVIGGMALTQCGHEETIVKGSLVHCKKCGYCFGVD